MSRKPQAKTADQLRRSSERMAIINVAGLYKAKALETRRLRHLARIASSRPKCERPSQARRKSESKRAHVRAFDPRNPLNLVGIQALIWRALSDAARRLTISELVEAVYHPSREPDTADACVRSQLHRLRRAIRPRGYKITALALPTGRRGREALAYRIERCAGAAQQTAPAPALGASAGAP